MVTSSFAPVSSNIIRSPQQAANTFTQVGGFARQRNVFIIRFFTNGLSVNLGNLTFATKSIERPRINTKVEELHQYNKKRQVFTGFKLEPIRVQFYDTADCIAQQMWQVYTQYYFGDLNNETQPGGSNGIGNQSYSYDVTLNNFYDQQGTGFGFTGANGGSQQPDSQFFFDRIEIYHFYDSFFDLYYLIHPRIQSFEMDELSYDNSEISLVTASLVYENLQYFPQNAVSGTTFEEFQNQFDGNPLAVPTTGYPTVGGPSLDPPVAPNFSVAALLASQQANILPVPSDFRYVSEPSGSISSFGQFQFGVISGLSPSNSLSAMTLGNPALTTALSLGTNATILSSSLPVLTATAKAATSGISGSTADTITPQVNGISSGYGTTGAIVSQSLLAAKAINGSTLINSDGQAILPAESYGTINSTQTGTAQYGFNTGYNENNGFAGPGPQFPPPYTAGNPYGIDVGRFVPAPVSEALV